MVKLILRSLFPKRVSCFDVVRHDLWPTTVKDKSANVPMRYTSLLSQTRGKAKRMMPQMQITQKGNTEHIDIFFSYSEDDGHTGQSRYVFIYLKRLKQNGASMRRNEKKP